MSNNYNNSSISMLKGAARVRERPGVIFGSDGLDGCEHTVVEILANSIDEAREGYGKEIVVTKFIDNSIEIEDHGRGCPVDYNPEEGRYNWELVFCELYAGGKYDNESGDNYEYSLGLNGLGSCATQYSSEYMDVVVRRDNKKYQLHFEKGENVGGLTTEVCTSNYTGTTIRWKPDIEVFTDIDIPDQYFYDLVKKQAVVNAGITFILKIQQDNEFNETRFCYANGINDYINEIVGEESLTLPEFIEAERTGRDRDDMNDYKVKLSAVFCFSNKHSLLEYYHNSSYLEYGGAPDKAVKSAFVSSIDALLKNQNKYQRGESKITFSDVQDCLVLITNCFSTKTSYENQTKKSITNKFIQDSMTEFFKDRLETYFIENPKDAERIMEQVLVNKRSRETAEKTRLNIKKKLSASIDISNRVQKFVDCRTKDVSKRELYVCEGDSALGAIKQSRDADFQGIMPVRGKIMNCLKADFKKVFESDIIMDLIRVLGCGLEVTNKHVKDIASFDINNLKWDKVIICTDADVDGYQIRALILTMIWRLCPTLINEHKIFIAETPLFEITCDGKTYFAYTEKEKGDIVKQLNSKKYKIDRSKGLGENDPDMMWMTTLNPQSRRLIRVIPSDAARTAATFELLLGDNLVGRKQHIAEDGHRFMDMIDVS